MSPPPQPQIPPVSGGFKPAAPGTPGSPFNADGTPRTPETEGGEVVVAPPHWQRWWHYNRDSYLNLSALLAGMDTRTVAEGGVDPAVQIAPLLQRALTQGGETQLIRGSLLALARMPEGDPNRQILPLSSATKHFLSADHPASREAAVIALGLGAAAEDLDKLLALYQNTDEGATLVDDELVDPRTRAFAGYGLALFANRTDDAAEKERIGRALLEVLLTDKRATYELHNASILALGLVPLPACDGTDASAGPPVGDPEAHLCIGVQLDLLNNYFGDGEQYASLRAHAAPALARLADGRQPEYKQLVADSMFAVLDDKAADPVMQEGAAIALGILGDCDNDKLDKEIRKALQKVAGKRDDLVGRQAMVAMARVAARGGENRPYSGLDDTRGWLGRQIAKDELDRDSWGVLSLAILAHDLVDNGQAVPEDVVATLRGKLKKTKDDQLATSLCIALGLLRDQDSMELFQERFLASDDAEVRGAAALGLGLLEARDAIPGLKKALLREGEDVGVVRQAAIALRLMGDRAATSALLERLGETDEVDEKATIVSTLGILHDPRAIPAVSSILGDEEQDDELRGVAAFALAELADRSAESWSEPLSSDLAYSMLSWTLESPFGDGSGVLDMRWW